MRKIVFVAIVVLTLLAGSYMAYNIINDPLPTPDPKLTKTTPQTSGTVKTVVPESQPQPPTVPETIENELCALVNTHALNVRECGDFYACDILTTLTQGTFVKADSCEGNWANIYFPASGWVNSDYLKPDICQ